MQLTLLELIAASTGGTYADYGKMRGRSAATTGKIIKDFWEKGWVRPDRELPAHWAITDDGREVLRKHADLLV